jgi:hypothetical protein
MIFLHKLLIRSIADSVNTILPFNKMPAILMYFTITESKEQTLN